MAPPAGGRRRIATEGGSCRRNRPLGRLSIMTDEKEYGSLGRLAPEWDGDGRERNLTADDIYERFFGWVEDVKGIEPWPHQEEAIMDLLAGDHVILNTPTGSANRWWRSACTSPPYALAAAPITPLRSRRWCRRNSSLGRSVRPRQCRHDHGDSHINADAPIICCTAESSPIRFARRHPCRCGPRGDGRIPLLR